MADYTDALREFDSNDGDVRSDYLAHRLWGVYVAVVTNIQDPENRARVKVRFPWLHDKEESWWARVSQYYAGKGRGNFWMPELDDEVLVVFERGDFHHPYIVGAVWNGVDNVPGPGNPDGENNIKHIELRSGHKLIFDDTEGANKISLIDSSGNNSIVIDVAADTILMEAKTGDINIEAPPGSVNLASKDLNVKVSNNATYTVTNHYGLQTELHQIKVANTQKMDVQGSIFVQTPLATVNATNLQLTAPTVTAQIASMLLTSSTVKIEGDLGGRTAGAETATIGTLEIKSNEAGYQSSSVFTINAAASYSASSAQLAAGAEGAASLIGGMVTADGSPGTVLVKGALVTLS